MAPRCSRLARLVLFTCAHLAASVVLVLLAARIAQGQAPGSRALGFVDGESLRFIDTTGRTLAVLPVSSVAQQFSVSDDGTRIVYSVEGAYGGSYVVWVYDVAEGRHTQLFTQDWCQTLAWLPGSHTQFVYSGPGASLYLYDIPSGSGSVWQSDDVILSQFGLGVYRGGIVWDAAASTVLVRIGADYGGGDIVLRARACTADASHHLCNLQAFSPTYGGSSSWANVSFGPAVTAAGDYGYYVQRINWNEHRLVRKSLTTSSEVVIAAITSNPRALDSPAVVSGSQVAVIAPAVGDTQREIWLCGTTPGSCSTIYGPFLGAGWLAPAPLVGPFATWLTASPGALQFEAISYSAMENGGSVTVRVTRSGGSAGAVGATVTTANGSALAGADYTAVSRAVTFDDGDTEPKAVTIALLDDGAGEGPESLTVSLSSATGGASIGTPATATVVVTDDDEVPIGTRRIYLAGGGGILEMDLAGRVLRTLPTEASVSIHMFDVSEDGSRVVYCNGGDIAEIWLLEAATGDNRKLMDAPWCATLKWLPGSSTGFLFNRQDGRLYRHDLLSTSTSLWQDIDTLAPWPVSVFRGGLDFDASGTRIVFRAGIAAGGNDMVVFGWACDKPAHRICDLQGATPPGLDWQRISYAPAISASGTHMYYLKRETPALGKVARRRLPATVGGAWGPEEVLQSVAAGTEPYLATLDLVDDSRLVYVGPNAAVNGWSLYSCTVSPLACAEVYQSPTWVAHVSVGPPLGQIAVGPPAGTEILVADSGRIRRLTRAGRVSGFVGTDPSVVVTQFDVTADGAKVAYCSAGDTGQLWLLDVAAGQNRFLRAAPYCSVIKWLPGSATQFLFTLSDGRIHRYDLATGSSAVWQDIDVLAPFGVNVYRHGLVWDDSTARVVLRAGQAYGGGDRVLEGERCEADATHHVCNLRALTGPGSGWSVIGFGPGISPNGSYAYYLKRLSLAQGQVVRRALPQVAGGVLGAEELLRFVASGTERYLSELATYDESHLVYVGEAETGGAWAVKYCSVTPFACTDIYRLSTGVNQLLVTSALATPAAPLLTSIAPASGPTSGGTTVVISGGNLQGARGVSIGGAAATVTAVRDTSITLMTPPGVAGAQDVSVSFGSGAVSRADGFTYEPAASVVDQGPADGVAADVPIVQPSLSLDGRHVAFASASAAYVTGDTNQAMDVFVRDRATDVVVRVSIGPDGAQANGPSERPRLSADGRYVAFVSAASNLVLDDTNGAVDVFVHDRDTDGDGIFDEPDARETFRVSIASDGQQADAPSGQVDLGPDGYWVAFVSSASNLAPFTTIGLDQVYLHHWPSRQTRRVSVAIDGGEPNAPSRAPAVSSAGQVVVFASDASNLVPNDTNGLRDVFLYDRASGVTRRVSTAAPALPLMAGGVAELLGEGDPDGASDNPTVDDAGDTIVFETKATNVVAAPYASSSATQVVVVDIGAALRRLLSQNLGGASGNGDSAAPEVSGDGTTVVFHSEASDLVPDDRNGERDVFVVPVDAQGEPRRAARVSLDREGDEARQQSQGAVLSADGAVVAFESDASLTDTTENTEVTNVFVRGVLLSVSGVDPTAVRALEAATCSVTGSGFAKDVKVWVGGAQAAVARHSDRQLSVQLPAIASPGAVDLVVANPDGQQVVKRRYLTVLAPTAADADLDGLPDAWETQYGLDARSQAGAAGAAGDPDGDGLTSLEEHANGTHPRGTFVGYFAEGATGSFFETELGFANATASAAHALLRFQRSDGVEVPFLLTIPAGSSRKVRVGEVAGMEQAEFSTVVESDVRLAMHRTMTWDKGRGFGSHEEAGLPAPAPTWYFAEGSTNAGFQLFYLVQNPNSTTVEVEFTFLLPAAAPVVKRYSIPSRSRYNVWVNTMAELARTDVSAVVRVISGGPVIVERAMYLDGQGLTFGAGHESAGVAAPARSWFLAEGATGPYFDMFLLLANPDPSKPATATVAYLLPEGRTIQKTYVVGAQRRFTAWVDWEDARLADTAVSTTVTSDIPILVERAMWWPGSIGTWHEAHNSFATTVTGTVWGVGAGSAVTLPSNTETYVLVANTSTREARVAVTLLFDDGGGPVVREFVIAPTSRFNVDVRAEFATHGVVGRSFGVLVESLSHNGQPPAQIVVEEAIYSDDHDGRRWSAGANALATRIR
jgi:Tol biopolymer transport system component